MQELQEISTFLNKELTRKKLKNPNFSLRSFARQLELGPSAVSEIINGKRRVSKKMAEKILVKMQANPTQRNDVLKEFRTKSYVKEAKVSLEISNAQFELISNWTYFALLSLMETRDFQSDTSWMAQRLCIEESEVKKALRNLLELEFIDYKNSKYKRLVSKINTNDDYFDLSIQKSHIQDMEIAKEKILNIDVKDRDFTSFTLPVDPKLLPKAKEIIRRAQDEIEALMEEGDCGEVYRHCSYLYPITKLQK